MTLGGKNHFYATKGLVIGALIDKGVRFNMELVPLNQGPDLACQAPSMRFLINWRINVL